MMVWFGFLLYMIFFPSGYMNTKSYNSRIPCLYGSEPDQPLSSGTGLESLGCHSLRDARSSLVFLLRGLKQMLPLLILNY